MSIRCAAMSLVCVMLAAAPVRAEEDPGEWFSDEAVVVVRVKKPKMTLAKVASLLQTVSPLYTHVLLSDGSPYTDPVNDLIERGFDLGHDIWVGFFLDADQNVNCVYVLHARDEDALRKSFADQPEKNVVRAVGAHTFVATSADLADKFETGLAAAKGSMYTAMSAAQRKAFEFGDISVFVNVDAYRKTIAKTAGSEEAARAAVGEMVNSFVGNPANNDSFSLVIEPSLIAAASQGIAAARGAVCAAVIDLRGIELDFVLEHASVPVKDKPTAEVSDFRVLERMPPGRQVYALGMPPFPSPAGWFLNVANFDSTNGKADLALAEESQAILRRLQKLKYGQWASAVSLPTLKDRELRLDAVAEVANPDAHRLMNNTLAVTQSQFVEFQQNRQYEFLDGGETFGEQAADVHRVTYKSQDEKDSDWHRWMHGPNGLVSRCLYQENLFVNTVGGGESAMSAALQRLKLSDPPTLSPGLAATREKLPPEASFMLLIDIPTLFSTLISAQIPKAEVHGELIDIFQAGVEMAAHPQSYSGVGLALYPERARLKVYIPTAQLREALGMMPLLAAGVEFF